MRSRVGQVQILPKTADKAVNLAEWKVSLTSIAWLGRLAYSHHGEVLPEQMQCAFTLSEGDEHFSRTPGVTIALRSRIWCGNHFADPAPTAMSGVRS